VTQCRTYQQTVTDPPPSSGGLNATCEIDELGARRYRILIVGEVASLQAATSCRKASPIRA
jgi:hypothetical protein